MAVEVNIGVFGANEGLQVSPCFQNKTYRNTLVNLYNPNVTHGGKQMFVFKTPENDVVYAMTIGSGGQDKLFYGFNGRPGSFVGIALAIKNAQFKDVNQAMDILDWAYENKIKGDIIESTGENKKFVIDGYEFSGDKIQSFMDSAIGDRITHVCQRGDWGTFKYNADTDSRVAVYRFPSARLHQNLPKENDEKSDLENAIKKIKEMGFDPHEVAEYILKKQKDF